MPKRPVKAQANSTRAASGAFGSSFGTPLAPSSFGAASSPLSYVSEPPDLSSISDPNLVVAFKNLSKKDGTTKAKALEELQTHITPVSGDVEDAILETWINFYPRTSIENARRVRQLAHTLQGRISLACGKRIAKYMPQVVGAWLAGTHDSDRAVSKAAQDALRQVFPTPEKLKGLRKAYQGPLLEFCQNVIDNETPQTLSDERTASPDEIEGKYSRVLAAVIALIMDLLNELPVEDAQKQQSAYAELLNDAKLWNLAYNNDPPVRRSVHRLLRVGIARQPEAINSALSTISDAYITHCLRSDQLGTSLDFSESLVALVKFNAAGWTGNSKAAKGVSRLCSFLKRGSQMGPPEFWSNVTSLFNALPREVYTSSLNDASEISKALHSGITKKDEPRSNLPAAWRTYVQIMELMIDALTDEDSEKLLQTHLLPIFPQYVRPSEQNSSWNLPDVAALPLLNRVLDIPAARILVAQEWPEITRQFVEEMQTSLPEQSKDYKSSQSSVAKQGAHWSSVQASLLQHRDLEASVPELTASIWSVIQSALQLLIQRNGKPYGAAAAVESILYAVRPDLASDRQASSPLVTFAEGKLPNLFTSPSATHLAGILYFLHDQSIFEQAWETTLQNVLDLEDEDSRERALHALLASPHIPKTFDLASKSPVLQAFISQKTHQALSNQSDWSFLSNLLKQSSNVLSPANADELLSNLTNALTLDDAAPRALEGLQTLTKINRKVVEQYMHNSEASQILPRLLYLSESPDESTAQMALNLNSLIQTGLVQTDGGASSQQTLFKTIRSGLLEASETSVSVETLIRLATEFISHSQSASSKDIAGLLPSTSEWEETLQPFLAIKPIPSLAVTSPLKGVVHLVEAGNDRLSRDNLIRLPRDAEGQSPALRIIQYTTALLKGSSIVSSLPAEAQQTVCRLLSLSVNVANDNLGVAGANHLWSQYTPEMETEMSTLVSDMQKIINDWLAASKSWYKEQQPGTAVDFVKVAIDSLLENSRSRSPEAFSNAQAYTTLVSELIEKHGSVTNDNEAIEQQEIDLRKAREIFPLTAILHAKSTSLASSSVATRWLNELIADLTGHHIDSKPDEGLYKLILVNALFDSFQAGPQSVAKQRAVFLIKHVIPWLSADVSEAIKAETFTILTYIVPVINDLYGEHWTSMLTAITERWSGAPELDPSRPEDQTTLPSIYSSLKLYTALLRATKAEAEDEEPNDDLVDALKDFQDKIAHGLFHVLTSSQQCPDELHQPLRIINESVARHIAALKDDLYPDPEQLYPLLFTPSQSVQQTAYEALHKKIPAMQDQISLDAALEKKDVKLPEELLSLLLEAPTTKDLEDAPWERGIPLPLRGYLLSWLLVFDNFDSASYKVKIDYLASLKELSPLPALLNFTFDFLGHNRGKPVDLSKFDITTYDASSPEADTPQKDCQHLLAHIYYLSLKHVPSLVKGWWIDLRARALVSTVESWTEKFVSPRIISAALTSVSQWAADQSDPSNPNAPPDGEKLKVSVSQKANEIRASYNIEEDVVSTAMSILIRLPGAWPLRQAEVQSVSRVGVDERKWQSWVRGCQGVITFSNNNITDGLLAFRRNVVGAMKGQTECAICYSIISSDKQLPSKRCSTCKNLFHSGCLYRWFKTSNASTCPLCRNPFNYG